MIERLVIRNFKLFEEVEIELGDAVVLIGPNNGGKTSALQALALGNREDRWWRTVKASDEFMDPVFEDFFQELGLPNLIRKTDYHRLAALVPKEMIASEVTEVLDAIVKVSRSAALAISL